MRAEKFDNTKPGYETDDIKFAFEYNGLAQHLDQIDVIVAEVCGANDEYPWHWILQIKDGTFRYATGSCDYTGWDCQSGATIDDPRASVEEVLADAPEHESSRKRIRETLRKQIAGELPFAVYQQ